MPIELDDRPIDALIKMSKGNPGAIEALSKMMDLNQLVDPITATLGGLYYPMLLDSFEIYGPEIYMLWSDVCNRDTAAALALLRATQMGIVSLPTLKHAIQNGGKGVDPSAIMAELMRRLPDFNSPQQEI